MATMTGNLEDGTFIADSSEEFDQFKKLAAERAAALASFDAEFKI